MINLINTSTIIHDLFQQAVKVLIFFGQMNLKFYLNQYHGLELGTLIFWKIKCSHVIERIVDMLHKKCVQQNKGLKMF